MKSILIILFTLTTFVLSAQPEHVFEIVGDNTGLLTAQEKITARRLKEHPRFAQGWTIALSKIENNNLRFAQIQLRKKELFDSRVNSWVYF